MSRRKKDPPPPMSTAWGSYQPDVGLYWKFGGPMIPVDEIPPTTYYYGEMFTTMKTSSRIRYIADLIEKAEEDLAKAVKYYFDLADRGIEAMPYQHYRDEDRKLDESLNDWTMVERNVDRHRASAYRTIAMNKNKLAAYRAQLAKLEVIGLPLFFGRS